MPQQQHTVGPYKIYYFLVIAIIVAGAFFRFYQLDYRMQFTWDQISNAWVMKDIIDDGKLPLLGMVAKGNSGFYIGAAYYYMLAPFYMMTNLDPIAAGIFVGVISIATLVSIFLVNKKMFSFEVGIVSLLIYAFSIHAIIFDRIPWPVSLMPIVSIGIFYFLYRASLGDLWAVSPLAVVLGFAFHIHFTAIYFVIITFLCLPLLLKHKHMLRQIIFSLPLFLVWFVPHLFSMIYSGDQSGSHLVSYSQNYFHGLHLARVIQLLPDGFIEFESILFFPAIKALKYVFLPVFSYLYIKKNGWGKGKNLVYLAWIWFLVPLVIMSLYSGEITNYYFATTRVASISIISYVVVELFFIRNNALRIAMTALIVFFVWQNIYSFVSNHSGGDLPRARQAAKDMVGGGAVVPFAEGDPKSYFYYLYGQRPLKK